MMPRRGFMQLMGLGTLFGPDAARGALAGDSNASKLLGASHIAGHAGHAGHASRSAFEIPKKFRGPAGRALFHRVFGVPESMRQMWRDRSQIAPLDADLQAMRSFSLSAKIRIQRERAYQRYEQQWLDSLTQSTGHETLRELRQRHPWVAEMFDL